MNRESYCGFHFISTFTSCPRKFFYKYIIKWVPKYTSPALSEGAAIHEGIARFYLTGDPQAAIEAAMDAIVERKECYEDEYKYQDGYTRVLKIVEGWLNTWAEWTPKHWKILHVEEPKEILVPGSNYLFTYRPDVEVEDLETGEIIIPDTKTSGFSLDSIYDSYSNSKQGTSYIFASHLQPEYQGKIISTLPDAIFWRSNMKAPQCERQIRIYRSEDELETFGRELVSWLRKITESSEEYLNGIEGEVWDVNEGVATMFPSNPTCDGGQSWKCEYKPICRHKIGDHPPWGFKLDDRPFEERQSEAERSA